MAQILAKFLISLVASQWLLSEAILFFPPVEKISQRALDMISVPTHDKWGAIASEPKWKELVNRIDSLILKRHSESVVSRKPVMNLANASREFAWNIREELDTKPYLSGAAIFGDESYKRAFRVRW